MVSQQRALTEARNAYTRDRITLEVINALQLDAGIGGCKQISQRERVAAILFTKVHFHMLALVKIVLPRRLDPDRLF